MIHPLPSGTRDVLPDESRELRAITEAIRGVFEHAGYGEVWTPAIEYESVVGREDGGRSVYRLFDDHGEVLLLRSDLTDDALGYEGLSVDSKSELAKQNRAEWARRSER